MSRVNGSTAVKRAGLSGLGVVCLAIATGCGSTGTRSVRRSGVGPTPAHSTPSPKSSGAAQPQTAESYLSSTARNARISAAVSRFGRILLRQYRLPGNSWGPFDVYCGGPSSNSAGGWMSQGYRPRPGDDCGVQHNPQYGGPNIQLDSNVIVSASGSFSPAKFVSATVGDPRACSTMIIDSPRRGWWVNNGLGGKVTASNDSNLATSAAQAQTIDRRALACLARTERSAPHL